MYLAYPRPWQIVKQPGGSTIHIEEAGGLGNVLLENSVVNHSILAGGVHNLTIRNNLVHGTVGTVPRPDMSASHSEISTRVPFCTRYPPEH